MQQRQCGSSGLRVSDLGLGTLTWGRDTDPVEASDMLTAFVDVGGTLVEGSPLHGDGRAPDVIGSALERIGRHRVVLAWRGASRREPTGSWTSTGARGDMLRSLDDSLARLGTDYVDLWLAEYDPSVPFEETLNTLEAAHRSGRALYIGLSHWPMWESAVALTREFLTGGPTPAAAEIEMSLLSAAQSATYREKLHERGVGILAHSPLAGGVLTGKYRHSTPPDSRAASPHMVATVLPFFTDDYAGILEAVVRAAQGLDRTPMDIALSWVRDHADVSATIIGPRSLRQLEQLLDTGAPLPDPIRQVLDEVAVR